MRRRVILAWSYVGLVALLAGCGSGATRGESADDWATFAAYQQDVTELETQVAVLSTFVPTVALSTPSPPFSEAWTVAVSGVMRTQSYPNYSTQIDAPLTLEARGVFLTIKLNVVNAGLQPVRPFPWWNLRLRDDMGRTFSPQVDATMSYMVEEGIRRPEEYQPGLVYDEAVVFDVPPTASGLVLRTEDGTLNLSLPAFEEFGTPPSTPPSTPPAS
jgi:hypothetical protein